MANLPPTPELDKRSAVMAERRDPTWVLTEFYDFLKSEGLHLMRWDTVERERVFGTGTYTDEEWVEDRRPPERLFAEFFGLDLDKIQDEQDALLKAIQDNNKEQGNG